MDFSWATISLIDIGIFSFGVIALATGWIVKKREDQRYNALHEEHENLQQEFSNFQSAADQRYNALHEEHENLQEEFSNFQSTSDRRYNTLQEESEEQYNTLQEEWIGRYNTLKAEWEGRYNALQQQQEILKEENATLRAGLDALTREHKALQTAHDRLSGRHAELVERVMPVFEILAREKLMEINAHNEN